MKKVFIFFAFLVALCSLSGFIRPVEAKDAKENEQVDLVLILDKSGSMSGLESDTIGGFNSMVDQQKKLQIPVYVTAHLFNDRMETLYDRKEIADVPRMTDQDYQPGGTTALLDAVGQAILQMSEKKKSSEKEGKVIFAIITDGQENASVEFSYDKIKEMTEEKQKKGWEFIYLGANLDAIEAAGAIGIDQSRAMKYKNNPRGVRANYEAIATYVQESVQKDGAGDAWKGKVEEDKD